MSDYERCDVCKRLIWSDREGRVCTETNGYECKAVAQAAAYKRAWQRDLEKGREFLAERDAARAEVERLRGALEAAKDAAQQVYVDYNERIDSFLKRGGTVRDEVYHELNVRVDAAMWSSQRVSEAIDEALAALRPPETGTASTRAAVTGEAK
jgi:hypothetical protein